MYSKLVPPVITLTPIFCRYGSISFLHQPPRSQKDDPGQEWVHQGHPPPEERGVSGHEHGHSRDLLVWYLPKEDLQVSSMLVKKNIYIFFSIILFFAAWCSMFTLKKSSLGPGWRFKSPQHSYGFRHRRSRRHCLRLGPWQPVLDGQHPQHHLSGDRQRNPPQNSLSPRPVETESHRGWPPAQVSPTAQSMLYQWSTVKFCSILKITG